MSWAGSPDCSTAERSRVNRDGRQHSQAGTIMETQPPGRETVEQLAEEFAERYKRGERPSLSEYAARYPEHAEAIRDLFPAVILMEQIACDNKSEAFISTNPSPRK